ncbi:MAG: hypothetical protein DWQ02_10960, partial [Bacteroidetes bacterium]
QFFAPQTTPLANPSKVIVPRKKAGDKDIDESQFLLPLSLDQTQPILLSMLVDPRAKVHANCGVLPIKDIHIPPDQYKKALQNIQIAFLSTPVLTPQSGIHISLPKEPGFNWSWIEIDGQKWTETSTTGILRKHQLEKHFEAQTNTIWVMLSQQGWIEITDLDKASVVPKDQRASAKLPDSFKGLENQIELLLESTKINAFDTTARFSGNQEIKEGWLKLSPGSFDTSS